MKVGETIAGFSIIKSGATGFYGQWYDAVDESKKTEVKLIVMDPKIQVSLDEMKRCGEEEKNILLIKSEFLCEMQKQFTHAGRNVLVFAKGSGTENTLYESLAIKNPLSAKEAILCSISIYKGLVELHRKGILHKNLHVETIFHDKSKNQVKLFGFGFKHFSELYKTDIKSKLVPYWPPETCLGGGNEDERSDLYSSAVVAFECFSGQTPFHGSFKEVKTKQITKTPPPLSSIVSTLPPSLDEFFRKSFAKSKDKRFESAKESLIVLEGIAKEMGVSLEKKAAQKRPLPKPSLPPPIPKKAKQAKPFMDEGLTEVEDNPLGFRNKMELDEMLESGKIVTPAPPDEMESGAFEKPEKPITLESIGSLRDAANIKPELNKTPTDIGLSSTMHMPPLNPVEVAHEVQKVSKEKRFPIEKKKSDRIKVSPPAPSKAPAPAITHAKPKAPSPAVESKFVFPKSEEKPKQRTKGKKASKQKRQPVAKQSQTQKTVPRKAEKKRKVVKPKKKRAWGSLLATLVGTGVLAALVFFGVQYRHVVLEQIGAWKTSLLGEKEKTIVDSVVQDGDQTVFTELTAVEPKKDLIPTTETNTPSTNTPTANTIEQNPVKVDSDIAEVKSDLNGIPLRENGQPDRPSDLIRFSIQSTPDGATVLKMPGAVRMGTTPYEFETTADDGTVRFGLQKEGFRFQEVSFPAQTGGKRSVILIPGDSKQIDTGGSLEQNKPIDEKTAENQTKSKKNPKKIEKLKAPKNESKDKLIDYELAPLE